MKHLVKIKHHGYSDDCGNGSGDGYDNGYGNGYGCEDDL